MRPVLCLVTNRHALAASSHVSVANQVGAAARAGLDLVQVRERDLDGDVLIALVKDCVAAVRGTRCRVVVNDRVDVALAAGAHGVHLPESGIAASRIRLTVPRAFLLGRSVHGEETARVAAAAGGLNYLLAGTVLPTESKPGAQTIGWQGLGRIVRATTLPVLAIGGIGLDHLSAVTDAGARGAAMVSWFAGESPEVVSDRVAAMCRMFDTPKSLS